MVSLLFGAIYLSYFSIIDVISSSEFRSEAAFLLNKEIELIRNIPFDDVGTVGGIPAGVISPIKDVTGDDNNIYALEFTVRNIDDPFDGTIGGTPNDTAPADYKSVEIKASCLSCPRFVPISITTTVAPKSLESASSDGSLFINVFDAGAQGVSGATVRVINNSTTPSIDLTDTTNASGVLQLVGVPTSTQNYYIQVNKNGYSSERTYRIGDVSNPNPLPQYTHATIQAQTLTTASFSIDKVSTLKILSSDNLCLGVASQPFDVDGTRTIGTPDVFKNNYSSSTDSNGLLTFSNVEWDTYSINLTSSSYDISGVMPFGPRLINPNSSTTVRYVLKSSNPNSLLVRVKDAISGNGIPSSTLTLARAGFTATSTTARATLSETTWSAGAYSSQDGGVDISNPTSLKLLVNASGTYSTTSTSWLISNTFDLGGTSTTFYNLSWNPTTQPAQTGTASLKFQLASNNDNYTWNFIGPDGTSGTYYSSSGASIYSGHAGDRYLRYKAYLSTQDEDSTPQLDDIKFTFHGSCVPLGQSLFQGLTSNDYEITASAVGYVTATSSVTVGSGWQATEIELTSL
jgi:hypothetical protein